MHIEAEKPPEQQYIYIYIDIFIHIVVCIKSLQELAQLHVSLLKLLYNHFLDQGLHNPVNILHLYIKPSSMLMRC